MKRTKLNLLTLVALSVVAPAFTSALSGCDTSGPKPGPVDPVRVDKAQQMRAILDKVDGDWDKLTPEDRTKFIQLTGLDDEKAKNWWVTMKYGLNGPPPGKGASGPR